MSFQSFVRRGGSNVTPTPSGATSSTQINVERTPEATGGAFREEVSDVSRNEDTVGTGVENPEVEITEVRVEK